MYLTPYRDEWIAERRALRSIPAAASNRTLQVARALKSLGLRPVLVSTGQHCFLRTTGRVYPCEVRSAGGVAPVIYPGTLGIPVLTYLYTLISLSIAILGLLRKQLAGSRLLIVYNFAPQFVIMSLVAKVFLRAIVVMEVEDIPRVTIKHFSHPISAGLVRQIMCFGGFKIMLGISSGTILAARSFCMHVPSRIPSLHLRPCLWDDQRRQRFPSSMPKEGERIRILYASSLDEEHGIRLLVYAMSILEASSESAHLFEVHVCGSGPDLVWVKHQCQRFARCRVSVHGFVSSERYRELLKAAHVAVSLQSATGLHGDRQFPSKMGEFMSEGKVVVTTVFGDIDEIPCSAVLKLHEESAPELAKLLESLCRSRALLSKISLSAVDYARTAFAVETAAADLQQLLSDIGYDHAAVTKQQAQKCPWPK